MCEEGEETRWRGGEVARESEGKRKNEREEVEDIG